MIDENSKPAEGSQALRFDSMFAQPVQKQFAINFWRFMITYWRTTEYNSVRFLLTAIIGLVFG